MASEISIANMALAEIAADSIASIGENSVSAREVNRVFYQCLDEMLEWSEFSWANKREVLAGVTNGRPSEWNYAFAVPADMATAIRVKPNDLPLPYLPFAESTPFNAPWVDGIAYPFLIDAGVIYTNIEQCVLEYGIKSDAIDISMLPAMQARALALEIAARIAYPVKKNITLRKEMIGMAEVAKARAIADNENRNPRRQPDYVSPVDYAREGYYSYGGAF
jgi:hypothetical protein